MEKYKSYLETDSLRTDLKKNSLRSGTITLVSQGVTFVLQMGSTMVLARILSPQDYGINAMAVAITGFASIFTNLGLSTATIQRAEITHEQVSTLFWINVAIGVFLSIIVAASSSLVASLYNTPEMMDVMLVLSITFILSGLTVQHMALLNRKMQFYAIAKINIISLVLSIVVAIIAARAGLGYWSLVLHSLTNVTCSMCGYWLVCGWVPGLPSRNSGVSPMIKLGSDLVWFNMIAYIAQIIDRVLIGRYIGSSQLGLYSKAYQILMMPISNFREPLARVAMPVLSLLQNDPEKYRNYYLKLVSILAFVSMPLVVFLFVCSDVLIDLLLGSQWRDASQLFRILAVAALIQPVISTTGMVLVSTGKSREYVMLGLAFALILTSCFIFGMQWGVKGIASGYSVAYFIYFFPALYLSFKGTKIKIIDFILSIMKPFLASLIMGFFCFVLLFFLKEMNIFFMLVICIIFSVVVYFLLYSYFFKGYNDIKEYLSFLTIVFNK